MKEKALFYLRRYLRELEDKGADFNQLEAAKKSMSYEARLKAVDNQQKLKHEYETVQWMFDYFTALQ